MVHPYNGTERHDQKTDITTNGIEQRPQEQVLSCMVKGAKSIQWGNDSLFTKRFWEN
jgi:hypothetical protein